MALWLPVLTDLGFSFTESTTYPANLQAGRPGDAGTEPKSRYYMAQCEKAGELRKLLKEIEE